MPLISLEERFNAIFAIERATKSRGSVATMFPLVADVTGATLARLLALAPPWNRYTLFALHTYCTCATTHTNTNTMSHDVSLVFPVAQARARSSDGNTDSVIAHTRLFCVNVDARNFDLSIWRNVERPRGNFLAALLFSGVSMDATSSIRNAAFSCQ